MSSIDADSLTLQHPSAGQRRLMVCVNISLALSVLLLAVAPLFVGSSYSVVTDTLSQTGGQQVQMAWVHRCGVLLASLSVIVMTIVGKAVWGSLARRLFRVYAFALCLLVVFPTSPWDGSSFDATIAMLHTSAAAVGGIAFIIGVVAVSSRRPLPSIGARGFDWMVVVSVAMIPQLMLVSSSPGLLQRFMVAIGYAWLFAEAARMAQSLRAVESPARQSEVAT